MFKGFGSSTIDLALYYWINVKETDLLETKGAGVKAIQGAFAQAGIEMPFPIQTVYLQQGAAE